MPRRRVARRRRARSATQTAEASTPNIGPLLEKLTVISRSLGALALRLAPTRLSTDKKRIHFLQAIGFDRHEIAGILGTTPGTVSVRLSEKPSPKRRRKGRRRG